MIRYKIFFIFLFLVAIPSCIFVDFSLFVNKFKNVDPELQFYIDKYEQQLKQKNKNIQKFPKLTAGFGRLENNNVGTCTQLFGGNVEIEIDSFYWRSVSEKEKLALIYHEATHCICDRHHNHKLGKYPEADSLDNPNKLDAQDLEKNGFFSDRCPTTLMYPEMPSTVCLSAHWDEYVSEIFSTCNL